jgi:hypothetical protein
MKQIKTINNLGNTFFYYYDFSDLIITNITNDNERRFVRMINTNFIGIYLVKNLNETT